MLYSFSKDHLTYDKHDCTKLHVKVIQNVYYCLSEEFTDLGIIINIFTRFQCVYFDLVWKCQRGFEFTARYCKCNIFNVMDIFLGLTISGRKKRKAILVDTMGLCYSIIFDYLEQRISEHISGSNMYQCISKRL